MGWSSSKNVWWSHYKGSTSGETGWKEKRGKTKIKVVKLYWEWFVIDGCKHWRKKAEDILTGYHSEGTTDWTARTICQWSRSSRRKLQTRILVPSIPSTRPRVDTRQQSSGVLGGCWHHVFQFHQLEQNITLQKRKSPPPHPRRL
jgi:hypothetical protein